MNKQLFESHVQSMIGTNQPLETRLQKEAKCSDIETLNHYFHLAHIQDVGTFDGCYRDSESGVLGGVNGLEFRWSDTCNFNAKCQLEFQENRYPIASTKGSFCYCTYSLPLQQIHGADDMQTVSRCYWILRYYLPGPGSLLQLLIKGMNVVEWQIFNRFLEVLGWDNRFMVTWYFPVYRYISATLWLQIIISL